MLVYKQMCKIYSKSTQCIIEGGSGMHAMNTLALTHESVYVAVYIQEFLLHYVTQCLGQTKCNGECNIHTVKNSTYFTALSSLSTGPVEQWAFQLTL